jgi:thiosulfate dehydrogenase [quinone] large subunit
MIQPQFATQAYNADQTGHAYRVTPFSKAAAMPISPAVWGVAVVEAAIGYEWLLSGLNKVLSADFSSGLAANLRNSLQGNPNGWYVSLANSAIIPHAQLFAFLAEAGEVMVGIAMFAGAALWVSGRLRASAWAPRLNLAMIGALAGGVLMSVNYAVMGGDTLPGINAGNAFIEGLSIDSLLSIIGIGLIIAHLAASASFGRTDRQEQGTGPKNHATRR